MFLRVLLLCATSLNGYSINAADDERPNILFCISDDQSWMHAGAYGCSWVNTPGFDRVAKDGLLFANAYTPNAKCAPSRACILTGRNTWQLEEACNHWPFFPTQFTSYVEVLAEHGYHVGSTGKGWAPGIAKDRQGKLRQLTGRKYNAKTLPPPTKAISRNDYAGNFAAFLNDNRQERPWCFWYGSTAWGGSHSKISIRFHHSGPITTPPAMTCWTTLWRSSTSTSTSPVCSQRSKNAVNCRIHL